MGPGRWCVRNIAMAFGVFSSNAEAISTLCTAFNAAKLMKIRGCFSGVSPRKSRRKSIGRKILIAGEGICLSTAVASHFILLQQRKEQHRQDSMKTVTQTPQATKIFDMAVLPTWQLAPLWLAVLFNILLQAVQPDARSRVTESDLSRRVDNMEQDLEESVAILRALTKQVEKVGVRAHATKRSVQDQVEQMSKLAESTSVSMKALVVRNNLLEQEVKELGEALENMQEQQARQVELISRLVENSKKVGSSRTSMQTQEPKTEIKDDYKYDFWLS